MREYEVSEPILNPPFEEPRRHWSIREGEPPELVLSRRKAIYYYRDPRPTMDADARDDVGIGIELKLVNLIRERVKVWRESGYPGVSRMTIELLRHWRRDGRAQQLFFAQLEAVETILFLTESRVDLRQGIAVPREELSDRKRGEGFESFTRYACKMATGSGKTTVMGMLAAWSILNKVNNRLDTRFSDVVLIVCPNVTIRHRLEELDPERGEASLYVRRDLVPSHLMPMLAQGRVLVTNWHAFELQTPHAAGVGSRVIRTGVERITTETITIGPKTTTARGSRYLTAEDYERQLRAGLLVEKERIVDKTGAIKRVRVEVRRYVESDKAFVARILGRDVGAKRNILILNDEAHHAYRIKRDDPEEDEEDLHGEAEAAEEYYREATIWIDGLDRINKERNINFCVDLSATPYFLGRVGQEANRPFPWVVSDFGLVEAIESGLVKIPQLAMRDTTGSQVPGYFNIWDWILPQLTAAERGGKHASPKPEAILKYAQTPITMLGGLWEQEFAEWNRQEDPSPPVFIVVCKNTHIARVVYAWLAEGKTPAGVAPSRLKGFRNSDEQRVTIRVDTKVINETDTGEAKSDEEFWMRATLDTVGKTAWPVDSQARPIYPEGFEEVATRLDRSLDPPGKGIRCIVSVGMLTEGWDCNTVTHIVGLRPFMSQLLCEQVVGRALRRVSYDPGESGLLGEEIATVFGVPFQVVPFKAPRQSSPRPTVKRQHVHAISTKGNLEIRFPRVEGYTQAIRNRISVDWPNVAELVIEPGRIPPEVQVKATLPTNRGRPSLHGPGRIENITLNPFRSGHRLQELVFELAGTLTREYCGDQCQVPPQALFPQVKEIVQRYLHEKVVVKSPADKLDIFLSPYYGWVVERLVSAIRPDASQGEAPEIPRYEQSRGPGSTRDVDFWTLRAVREVERSHVNVVVADTQKWEQQAAYFIDRNRYVDAFVKNAGLGFAIPYLDNGRMHDYQPDFILRLRARAPLHLILETKGFDPKEDVKRAAAERWVAAVNADRRYGIWRYALVKKITQIDDEIRTAATAAN